MKKGFMLLLCAVLCFSFIFSSCDSNKTEDTSTPSNTEEGTSNTPNNEETPDATTNGPTPTQTTSDNGYTGVAGTVAHWKLQNDEKYFSGTLNGTDLTFKDITGNGNDLIVQSEGEGSKLDIFSWTEGSTLTSSGTSALYFGNTYDIAKSVNTYSASETEYTGGTLVSGKYLETVESAPMNDDDFAGGYTIEAIIKVDSSFNNNYNRYAGIFSRQGLINNEPWFSLAVAETSNTENDGSLKGDLILQLVQSEKDAVETSLNAEFSSINPDVWVHYMAVCEESGDITVYVNGTKVDQYMYCKSIGSSGFGWEVGVGRKDFTGMNVKNPQHPEGGIRRLFCGTISEIRVIDHAISLDDSLYSKAVDY